MSAKLKALAQKKSTKGTSKKKSPDGDFCSAAAKLATKNKAIEAVEKDLDVFMIETENGPRTSRAYYGKCSRKAYEGNDFCYIHCNSASAVSWKDILSTKGAVQATIELINEPKKKANKGAAAAVSNEKPVLELEFKQEYADKLAEVISSMTSNEEDASVKEESDQEDASEKEESDQEDASEKEESDQEDASVKVVSDQEDASVKDESDQEDADQGSVDQRSCADQESVDQRSDADQGSDSEGIEAIELVAKNGDKYARVDNEVYKEVDDEHEKIGELREFDGDKAPFLMEETGKSFICAGEEPVKHKGKKYIHCTVSNNLFIEKADGKLVYTGTLDGKTIKLVK